MNSTILFHELRQGFKSLIIWTLSILFLMVTCVALYPQMQSQMEGVNDIFASMGAFTQAFGMDRLNFGSFIGFYSVECGNILGLGGAMFAALLGIGIIAKEESNHTSEFLYTMPLSRNTVLGSKLLAVLIQIIALNVLIFAFSLLSAAMVDKELDIHSLLLLHTAFLCSQIEISAICFGASAFIRGNGLGIGLGLALLLYFMNIIANIAEPASFLKYITPFGYTEAADIIADGSLSAVKLLIGLGIALAGILLAFIKYSEKDLK